MTSFFLDKLLHLKRCTHNKNQVWGIWENFVIRISPSLVSVLLSLVTKLLLTSLLFCNYKLWVKILSWSNDSEWLTIFLFFVLREFVKTNEPFTFASFCAFSNFSHFHFLHFCVTFCPVSFSIFPHHSIFCAYFVRWTCTRLAAPPIPRKRWIGWCSARGQNRPIDSILSILLGDRQTDRQTNR